MKRSAIRLGIIGVGGFAGRHHAVARELEEAGEARLIATCDPSAEALEKASAANDFQTRDIRVFQDYRQMLDACRDDMDVVVIPTPIPLHAEMHRTCVELGLAVYLEKPPTLDPQELEEMIETDSRAAIPTAVGFNLVADGKRRELQERIVSGEFGAVREVLFTGLAPRPVSYFDRAGWAGRVRLDGRLILDSCFGNAMAHYVHNALLWAGTSVAGEPARPTAVEAETYRAHQIEGADTFFVAAETDTNVRIRIGMTHASAGETFQEENIVCERALIRYRVGKHYEIDWKDRPAEHVELPGSGGFLRMCHLAFYECIRGVRSRPLTRLKDCRPFVHLNGLAYLSAGAIHSVDEDNLRKSRKEGPMGELDFIEIEGIGETLRDFVASGRFPSRQGAPWAKPGKGQVTPEILPQLARFGL